jgi:hypothetical protein
MKYDNQISELRNLLEGLESLSELPEPVGAPLMEVIFEMIKNLCEKTLEPGEVPVETKMVVGLCNSERGLLK